MDETCKQYSEILENLPTDPIKLRRVVNQHNLDCFTLRTHSLICECTNIVSCMSREKAMPCNRCLHRGSMDLNKNQAYVGYESQTWS